MKCGCDGYHFPHRKGGGACFTSPTRDLILAIRSKDDDLIAEARFELGLTRGVTVTNPMEIPF